MSSQLLDIAEAPNSTAAKSTQRTLSPTVVHESLRLDPLFRTLRPELVGRWLAAVSGRALTEREQRALRLRFFRGSEGVAQLNRSGFALRARLPQQFEAILWHLRIDAFDIVAVLTTPVEMSGPPQSTGTGAFIFRTLAGTLRASQGPSKRLYRPDTHGLLSPSLSYSAATEDIFSFVGIHIQTELTAGRHSHPPEGSRLRAGVEFGRALLVERLTTRTATSRDSAILQQLLIADEPESVDVRAPRWQSDTRRTAEALIERDFNDPEFSVDSLANEMRISRRHLYRHFIGHGDSIATIITNRRLSASLQVMAKEPTLSFESVAARTGFHSADNFRRAFMRRYGMTPQQWRIDLSPDFDPTSPAVRRIGENPEA